SFVVDFGEGQLVVGKVRRSAGSMQGLEFEVPLVDDGAGGLCTRHRVSPYVLAQAGMPLQALPPGQYPMQMMQQGGMPLSLPKFGQVEGKAKAARLG
ncbi:MAG: GGDEF domain-containing protein, partial [Novosphingobium sp.]|nr:GGDEF domain-containing protein [Novosphingobium sp.]